MTLTITVLGSGNSSGVPSIGNYWGHCDPTEIKNKRTRCSIAVQSKTTTIIVDTGPDFKEQFNRENLNRPDAVFYTHAHGDHCHGIDDLRSFYFRISQSLMDVYGSKETIGELEHRFPYMFHGGNNEFFYPPLLRAHRFEVSDYGCVKTVGDISFIPFQIDHGSCICTGYRFGDFAYCVDMKSLDKKALDILQGVKCWIVDGAAYKTVHNAVHANLEDIYHYNQHIRAEKVYITSLTTQMDYATMIAELPLGYFPCYDGLKINT